MRMANLRKTMINLTVTLEQERAKWKIELEKLERERQKFADITINHQLNRVVA